MNINLFITAVAMRHCINYKFKKKDIIWFEKEPNNKWDKFAIKIMLNETKVAYIPCTENRYYANKILYNKNYVILDTKYSCSRKSTLLKLTLKEYIQEKKELCKCLLQNNFPSDLYNYIIKYTVF